MNPRPYVEADLDAMLALNNAHATELGPLDSGSLARLLEIASRVRITGAMDGFLIGLDETADYASPNFLWFKARFARFAYIDRVVVADAARGRGIARALYEDFFAFAREERHERIVCEVNYDPPNPASEAFHTALGFAEIGRATLADRGKSVRYLARATPVT